jgi:hypothetical protein
MVLLIFIAIYLTVGAASLRLVYFTTKGVYTPWEKIKTALMFLIGWLPLLIVGWIIEIKNK